MNTARHRELEASLRRELERHALEENFGSVARVGWLLDQVENYLERWLALGTSTASTMGPSDDDLFRMIEVGAEATSAEVQYIGSPALAAHWREFLSVLASAQAGMRPQRLTESLAAVRRVLVD